MQDFPEKRCGNAVLSLNFSSVGKGPFLMGKVKNTMYAL